MPLFQNQPVTEQKSSPLVIAHRGASGLAPENTLAAFRLAIALGADGIELDVQLSADRRAVVIHDARVNRTTDGLGAVGSLTADQLNMLDAGEWFDKRLAVRPRARAMAERAARLAGNHEIKYSGEPVPTLESTLSLLAPAGLRRIYVELKDRPANKEALLENVVALARRFRLEDSITLLSFDHQIIRRAKKIAPEIRAAATFAFASAKLATGRTITRDVEEAGADEAALHFGLVTRRLTDALHERGLTVSVWTANNKLIMRRLISCGVDSIMTNFPNRLIDVLDYTAKHRDNKGAKRE